MASRRKRRSVKRRKKSGRRGMFTRASARASMRHCRRCGRTIFGGDKGLRTHNRKKHRR